MRERVAACLILLTLLACGGGGGGSSSGSSAPSASLILSATSISLTGFQGQAVPTQTLTATLNTSGGTFYYGVSSSLPGVISVGVISMNSTKLQVIVGCPGVATTPGIQNATITFTLYSDPGAKHLVWSGNVNVELTVFGVDHSSLDFSTPQTAPAPTSQIKLSPADTQGRVVASAPGFEPWLNLSRPAADTIAVKVASTGMPAGSYPATVRLSAGSASLDIPLTLTVISGIQPPAAKTLTLDAHTLPAGLSGTFSLAFDNSVAPAWTASSDRPWLVLPSPSGTGPGSIAYTVDPALINGADPHWTADTATVTIQATGLSPVTTGLLVQNAMPQVSSAQPFMVLPQTPTAIQVYGKGFNQLGSGTGIFLIGGTPVSATLLSDTQALVNLGALAAGKYAVQPKLQINGVPLAADLIVETPTAFPAAFFGLGGNPRSSFFDPTRNAVFAALPGNGLNQIVRAQYDAASHTWQRTWLTLSDPLTAMGDMGMSLDHRRLYVALDTGEADTASSSVIAVDPDSMKVISTFPFPLSIGGIFGLDPAVQTQGAQATRNNQLWFLAPYAPGYVRFDAGTGQFVNGIMSSSTAATIATASGDGETLLVGTGTLNRYSALQDQFLDSVPASSSARLNGDGSRVLIDGQVLKDVLNGYARLGVAWDGLSAYSPDGLLSSDATKVYRARIVILDALTMGIDQIDVYDTTQGGGANINSYFPMAGSIPLSGLQWDTSNGYSAPTLFCNLAGDTLFVEAAGIVYVVPVPVNLQPALRQNPPAGALSTGRMLPTER